MGRIKTRTIKSATRDLFEKHSDKIETTFEDNKSVVSATMNVKSKKLRNIISGYAARLKKADK